MRKELHRLGNARESAALSPIKRFKLSQKTSSPKALKPFLLIGQGGSTQAPMTITKYNKVDRNALDFKVLDSVSPVRVRSILAASIGTHARARFQQIGRHHRNAQRTRRRA